MVNAYLAMILNEAAIQKENQNPAQQEDHLHGSIQKAIQLPVQPGNNAPVQKAKRYRPIGSKKRARPTLSKEENAARLALEREAIKRFSRPKPDELVNGMIWLEEQDWAFDSELDLEGRTSLPLGRLERLPLEILHAIFRKLDFKTLMRITETSTRGLSVVRSMPEYRDLMKHAPETLGALGYTGLIVHHSAATLHKALLSSTCVSCGDFGAYLFLPTAERCCSHCLINNPALWVISTQQAKTVFATGAKELKRLPVMRSVEGTYYRAINHDSCYCREYLHGRIEYPWTNGYGASRNQRLKLVSVKAAKAIALEKTPQERLWNFVKAPGPYPVIDRKMTDWLIKAPMEGNVDVSKETWEYRRFRPEDRNCFMASIPFPRLRADGSVDHGHMCKGCMKVFEEFHATRRQPPHYSEPAKIAEIVPAGREKMIYLENLTLKQHSREGLLEHVANCHGAWLLDKAFVEQPQVRRFKLAEPWDGGFFPIDPFYVPYPDPDRDAEGLGDGYWSSEP